MVMGGPTYTETVERFDQKLDRVIETQREIEKRQAATNEHLKALNSQVSKNVTAIAGQSRAIERNTTNIANIFDRAKEHRLATDKEHEELIRLRISAKGEEVEQEQIKGFTDMLRANAWKIGFGVTQAIIIAILLEHIGN